MKKKKLRTDTEFQTLSIPLTQEKQEELYRSLAQEGCKEPLIVWNGILIDGYKRLLYCQENGVSYTVEEKSFPTQEDAIAWVCKNRIPQYKTGSAAHRYLVGRYYHARRKILSELRRQREQLGEGQEKVKQENKQSVDNGVKRGQNSIDVGEELNITYAIIEGDSVYASYMLRIAEKNRDMFVSILSGEILLPISQVKKYSEFDEDDLRDAYRDLLNTGTTWQQSLSAEMPRRKPQRKRRRSPTAAPFDEPPLDFGIKRMPAFDPDMELRGLMLTIPTWIMAIARVEKKTAQATEQAKIQLTENLRRLKDQVDEIIGVLNDGRNQFD